MAADNPVTERHLPPQRGGTGKERPIASERAYFQPGPLVAIPTLSLAHGGAMFVAAASLITMAVGHTEHVESLLYPATFALLLPLAVIAAHYQLAPFSSRTDVSALLAGGNLAALSAILVIGHLLLKTEGVSALRIGFLLGAY